MCNPNLRRRLFTFAYGAGSVVSRLPAMGKKTVMKEIFLSNILQEFYNRMYRPNDKCPLYHYTCNYVVN